MYEQKEGRAAKCTHYVSTANNRVYPALRNVPGFEDDNPSDWRPATRDEIDAYERGETVLRLPADTVHLDQMVVPAAPSTITLASDEPVAVPPAPVQPTAPAPTTVVSNDPPPAPPGAIPAAPAFPIGQ